MAWQADRPQIVAAKSTAQEYRSFPLLLCPSNEHLKAPETVASTTCGLTASNDSRTNCWMKT